MDSTRKLLKLGFGKHNDDIATPDDLYEDLDSEFNFDFDPCPLNSSFDGLSIEWGKRNFVNPPFSDVASWAKKAVEEMSRGHQSVFLIPLRTNTQYWHNWILQRSAAQLEPTCNLV